MNTQLTFDFKSDSLNYPAFDSFLGKENAELLQVLKMGEEPMVFVWGRSGSGKSHLLQAWISAAHRAGKRAIYIPADREDLLALLCEGPRIFDGVEDIDELKEAEIDFDCVAVDDIHLLTEEGQSLLFTAFNRLRDRKAAFLAGAEMPPSQLPVREDLRTRMGWTLIYEILPLNDAEKQKVLYELAQSRQMYVDDTVYRYLFQHTTRNLDMLIQIIQGLDDYALSYGRRITVPLLKAFLQEKTDE